MEVCESPASSSAFSSFCDQLASFIGVDIGFAEKGAERLAAILALGPLARKIATVPGTRSVVANDGSVTYVAR